MDKILIGDCIQHLKTIPDNSVDMCFADPPFNLDKKYAASQDKLSESDYLAWCAQWLLELVRVTKPTGSILLHNIPRWLTHYAGVLNACAVFRHWIAWDVSTGAVGRMLQPSHYGILFYTKTQDSKFYGLRAPHEKCRECNAYIRDYGGRASRRHPFGYMVSDVWTDLHRLKHRSQRDDHPCQLPIPLLERMILMTTDQGDVVLDPFLGTGTTAIAAARLGRDSIGIELSEQYARIAQRRVRESVLTEMNGRPVSIVKGQIRTIRDEDAKILFPPEPMGKRKRPGPRLPAQVIQQELFESFN